MNKNKGIIGLGLIVAIVLGIVVVGGGAYYLGKNKGENKEVKSPENVLPNNESQKLPVVENKQETKKVDSVKTYIYKNHGFTMELPVGYIPSEQQAEGGPSFSIELPNNSHLNYITDASFWEKYNIPQYKYIKNEKIGETTFKVYIYGVTLYYFKQGNVAYEYSGDKSLLNTFKFVGWDEAKTASSEESSTETFKNQPGDIKSIKADGANKWILAVDLLTLNPKWIPGGSEEVFSNQNTKIRNLNVNNETKSYKCGYGPSGNVINNVLKNNIEYIKEIQSGEYKIRFFDINGTNITSMYEQCLP